MNRIRNVVAGLVLAFTAAVFSSAARESGNLLATAIFASTALFLAGLVGVTTVPFLARRVAAGRRADRWGHGVRGPVVLRREALDGGLQLRGGRRLARGIPAVSGRE